MKRARLFALALFLSSAFASAQVPGEQIISSSATVEGVKIHYLAAGHGPTLLLLHGYTQDSRMWRPVIPVFAKKFHVIAPDLPGFGLSDVPPSGLDMKSAAVTIHALMKDLGIDNARVVGHDIGLMVAYAYAAQYPSETEKLVLMDAFLPGVPGWEPYYNNPRNWHFRFNGPTPEHLVAGRERAYFEHYWNDFAADKSHSIPEVERVNYTLAYARPGRMRAGWAYFANFLATAKDFEQLSQTKLAMPVLVIAGEKASAGTLGDQGRYVATNCQVVTLKNTGHWLMEEDRPETMAALQNFL